MHVVIVDKLPKCCVGCKYEGYFGECKLINLMQPDIGYQEFDEEWHLAHREGRRLKYCPLGEKRKQGQWIVGPTKVNTFTVYFCSECHKDTFVRGYKFCPECGAEMHGMIDSTRVPGFISIFDAPVCPGECKVVAENECTEST